MENETTDRHIRPAGRAAATTNRPIAVDFRFDDRAAPSAAEIAVVSAILPDILRDLLAATEMPQEN